MLEQSDEVYVEKAWRSHLSNQIKSGRSRGAVRRIDFVEGFSQGKRYEATKPIPDHAGWPTELRFIKLAHELSEHPAVIQMLLANSPNAVALMKELLNTKLHGSDTP